MDITYTITQTMRPNGALIKMEAWESNEETHYIVTNSKTLIQGTIILIAKPLNIIMIK